MVVLFVAADASAQRQMKDFIKAMPDSLVPYLNITKRTELIDFYEMGVEAATFNRLSENTVLDSLTANFADLRLSERSRMQLALLSLEGGDTLICMVRTYLGEEPESNVAFYDAAWHKQDAGTFLSVFDPMSLMVRPDTMSEERYEQLVRMVDPVMTSAVVDAKDQTLTFSLSTPMLRRAEREELKAILVQRKFKWNGRKFN